VRPRVLLLVVLALALVPEAARALLLAGTPHDFADRLFLNEHVFVATVDSVSERQWKWEPPCEQNIPPMGAARLVLRIEEQLHGDSLETSEVLWSDSPRTRLEARVGQRVIAWGNQICRPDRQLWGEALVLTDSVIRRTDGVTVWEEDGPREPGATLLARFRSRLERQRSSGMAFGEFDGLAIARFRSRVDDGVVGSDLQCDWVGVIAGEAPQGSFVLHVRAGSCPSVAAGDSLLIPWIGTDRQMTIFYCPDPFRIDQGRALGLGVNVVKVRALIEERGGRLGIPRSRPSGKQ
jgi:hypothetical protein